MRAIHIKTGALAVMMLSAGLLGCEKDADQWLQDNIDVIGIMPEIASFAVAEEGGDAVGPGSAVELDLRFWSEEEIDEIRLRSVIGNETNEVDTYPYQKAYSEVTRTDSLIMTYQVPQDLDAGQEIILEAEVINTNTLSKSAELSLTVE